MKTFVYIHPQSKRQAQISFYENDEVWAIEVFKNEELQIQGIYPSLSCAQLILSALGFVDQKF